MKKFLVVDFEFTTYERPVGRPRGFFSEIIEIGAVKLDGEPLTDCGRIQSFVKPHFYPKQAKDSMDFCMITAKDMQQAIEFPAMVEELAALYESGETYFVAWGTEDYKVLQTGCERNKIENHAFVVDSFHKIGVKHHCAAKHAQADYRFIVGWISLLYFMPEFGNSFFEYLARIEHVRL